MPDREERMELRGLIAGGDGAGVVRLLTDRFWPEDALQLIGDGLVIALRQQVEGAADLAATCAAELRARAWEGDEELADMLQALLGTAPTRLLKPLPVDLEELAMALEGDPVQGGGRIDLTTGEVWPQAAIDYAVEAGEMDEDDDDSDRWLWFDSQGSRPGYRDMQWFIADLDDAGLGSAGLGDASLDDADLGDADLGDAAIAERLDIAIRGRGAFRRFKDTLSGWPDLMARWFACSEDRQRGRTRAWLAGQGYAAHPPSPRL